MRSLFTIIFLWFSLAVIGGADATELILPTPDLDQTHRTRPLDMNHVMIPGEVSRHGKGSDGSAAPSTQSGSSALFREAPSISGRYSVGGTMLLPFIAAGFNGGYTERERAINPMTPIQGDQQGLRGQWSPFGQGMAPNEFQMGVRIPF